MVLPSAITDGVEVLPSAITDGVEVLPSAITDGAAGLNFERIALFLDLICSEFAR
jgi:hypothetical protein